jgi:hypothetical protein
MNVKAKVAGARGVNSGLGRSGEGYAPYFNRTFAYEIYYYGIYFYEIYFYFSILLLTVYTSP